MKKSWDIESFEMIPMRVEFEEYNQLLDEMAELVYGYLCQLHETPKASEMDVTTITERTGSDG